MNTLQTERLAGQIELACLIEATARKPGNVHPAAAFDDLDYDDFLVAAKIAAPILAHAGERGVGRAVLEAVQATVAETGSNVNLGICLLIAPLAAVPARQSLSSGIHPVMQGLTVDDARAVYEAIRLAHPAGLGEAPDQDVQDEPTQTLLAVMKLAAERDGIAAEYAKEFRLVYLTASAWLKKFLHDYRQRDLNTLANLDHCPFSDWEFATIGVQTSLLMMQGDTHIRRKCGDTVFHETACRAEYLVKAGLEQLSPGHPALRGFDAWLRADGHRRNPGTTADLIAAIWFVAIRDGLITPPTREEVLAHAERIRMWV